MAKLGIDISTFQRNIDLEKLKDKIDFVIIRVGFGVSGTIDNKFKRNVELCKALNIPFGFYWYSYALNEKGAEAEAKAFLKAIEPYKNDYSYGCWFDMEDADGYKRKKGMPSNQTLRNICAKFCSIVEEAGYYVGVYASLSWFNNQLRGTELNRYDKWIAQWPTSGGQQLGLKVNPDSKTDRNLWQFTSLAKIEGYDGRLDANYAYRDYPNIIAAMRKPVIELKPIEEIAQEVIDGKWGDNEERVSKLTAAGYDVKAVQDKVDEILKKKAEEENLNIEYYTVQQGDSLGKIAIKYRTTWRKIYANNQDVLKDPRVLTIGQKLRIIR